MTFTIAAILFIIIVSVFLIITEIFFIPGTTFFGIAGTLGLVLGFYMAFSEIGNQFGYISIAVSLVFFILFFGMGKRMASSEKFTLKDTIVGKVNVFDPTTAKIGDTGKTTGDLRPNGKANINNRKIEVYSMGGFIEKDTEVEVLKISGNKVYVKPLNT